MNFMKTDTLLHKAAPKFSLLDQAGKMHSLTDYQGKLIVLYFYPKDMTPGCTIEACDFRDNLARVKNSGAVVLGVSADSVKRHAKFAAKEDLNFPVLSDESHDMLNAYGVWQKKKMMGQEYMGIIRTTLLIDAAGIIQRIWTDVKVTGHVDEVLAALKGLKK